MKQEKPWNEIAKLFFALGLYEFSNKFILVLEDQDAFNSIEYLFAILVMSASLLWCITVLMNIYKLGKNASVTPNKNSVT